MEAISIKEVSMNEVKVYSDRTEDDNRRYAYEKAIEAYWKHVDRYHTWMNYYAIFNGALFVGFCTLLTSTTTIEFGKNINLENSYNFLCVLICIMGAITSICWYNSILGHEKWENNWMNIIEFYEIKIFSSLAEGRIYNMLILNKESLKNSYNLKDNNVLDDKAIIKNGYSTHALTKCFVLMITIAWLILIFHKCIIDVETNEDYLFSVLTIIIVGTFIIIYMGVTNIYSSLFGKIWKSKNIDELNKITH